LVIKWEETGEFEIEEILDSEKLDGIVKYYIKWKDYLHVDNTWEPIKHLTEYQTELR